MPPAGSLVFACWPSQSIVEFVLRRSTQEHVGSMQMNHHLFKPSGMLSDIQMAMSKCVV